MMIVLGVESSCDETSVSVVKDGKEVLSNVIYSQIKTHAMFGGVVPEVASRCHTEIITYVFKEAIEQAKIKIEEIDLVAVTEGPGLIGCLLVGINAAKAFAYANDIPIIGVNHMTGHIYANYIENEFSFPLMALVVSGGHTELVLMKDHYNFEVLGTTLDDAVGETYDKVGRVIGLPYPAGAAVDKLAHEGKDTYKLPRVFLNNDYNFSLSGLKSAVINLNHNLEQKNIEVNKADLCCSFQEAVTDVLVDKTIKACNEYNCKQIILAGGVAANRGLREKMEKKKGNIKLTYPSMKYCTDNAAMIAVSGYFKYKIDKTSGMNINGNPSLDL